VKSEKQNLIFIHT